ncbi:dnaJ homolog subfamily C member 7 [Diachasma alloeum]|uniref:dnaJ homolog subfamily C member 7 n=1 Tax=Diachasma alloeum TaxID=454923 RepID=UPI0007382FD3|nr:dnaJ homolog subfamily C member 7 [Diachasma alloeum]
MSGNPRSTSIPQNKVETNPRHEQSKGRGIPVKACIKCGAVWKRMHYCPAEKETCKACGKIGHLTECCLFKKGNPIKPHPMTSRRRHGGQQLQESNPPTNNNNVHNNKKNSHGGQSAQSLMKREIKSESQSGQSNAGKYEKSISHYSRLIKLCPKDPQNYNNRSICYMMSKQYENAFADASKVIELNPSSVESYCRLIKCAIILGCTMEAAIHLKKLSQLDPENETLLIEREKLNELQGYIEREKTAVKSENYKEALASVCESLVISSENLSLKIKQAEYLALLKRYKESEEIVKEILEKDANNLKVKYILGIKKYDLDIDAAVMHFEELIKLDPGTSKVRDLYEKARRISEKKKQGNDAFLNKNFEAAHNHYLSALGIDPDHMNMKIKLYFNMGQASWNLKKYERAIVEYERVINGDDKHYLALKQRGKCYLEIRKYKEAIADFSKVLTLCPTDPDCLQLINNAVNPIVSFLGKDPYEILGIRRDSSLEEIKEVYEHKELLHYLNRVLDTTEEQKTKYENDFKEVTFAYDKLLEMIGQKANSKVDDSSIKLYNLFNG